MREIHSKVTSKGQITLPKAVREWLGVSEHDKVAFVLQDDGTVMLRRPLFPTVASLAGAAGSLGRNISWDEMRAIAHEDRLATKPGRHAPDEDRRSEATPS